MSIFRPGQAQGGRKKIKHFSYSEGDRIGKGYSSIVYKATNELTSTASATQMKQSQSKPSTCAGSRTRSAGKC